MLSTAALHTTRWFVQMTVHCLSCSYLLCSGACSEELSRSYTGRDESPAAAGANSGEGTWSTEVAYEKQQPNNPPTASQSGPITDVLWMAVPNTSYLCPAKATNFSQNLTLFCENIITFVLSVSSFGRGKFHEKHFAMHFSSCSSK